MMTLLVRQVQVFIVLSEFKLQYSCICCYISDGTCLQ